MSEEKNLDYNPDRFSGTVIKKAEAADYLAEILPELAQIAKMANLPELSDRLKLASALAIRGRG